MKQTEGQRKHVEVCHLDFYIYALQVMKWVQL